MSAAGSFWARRRAAVQAEAELETRAARDAEAISRAEELSERDDAYVLAELGLPDPDGMASGDDVGAFLSKEVPEHLRRRALRALWRSNPVLACVDGLNEYDDDYRAAMLLQEPIKTAYQVGKGMKKHIDEMERKAQLAAAEMEGETEAEGEAEPEPVAQAEIETEDQPQLALTSAAEAPADDAGQATVVQDMAAPPLRRMRFRFEEATA